MEKNFELFMNQSARPVQAQESFNQQLVKKWKELDLYAAVNAQLGDTSAFVLVDGPPYANGGAHLGHALNKVWKDVAVKSQWFLGRAVRWTPGWDCHGLPLELQVDKLFPQHSVQEKKEQCKRLALHSVAKQKRDFMALGVHAHWQHPYLTLSQPMQRQSWRTLAKMSRDDLLQYKLWPVHHCPACASSLAEAELEYEVKERDELYFKYRLSNGAYALVWTTTAWTLPMNQALAFNESLTYEVWTKGDESLYVDSQAQEQVVQMLLHAGYVNSRQCVQGDFLAELHGFAPFSNRHTPVLKASFVQAGHTGFVHVALAHGVEDYELGVQHGLQPLNLLDSHGRYVATKDVPQTLHGKKNHAVSQAVFDLLGADLLHVYKSKVEQAHCWRHKTKVYYQAAWQVFLDLDKLKPRVKELLGNCELSASVVQRLEQMLLGRPHWCLSRQRYWGTALNVLVDSRTMTLSPLSAQYLEMLADEDHEQAKSFLQQHPELFVVNDVLDVWFDSGNVVQALGHYQGFEQADLVLEGKDQFRGWFQSLLWMQAATSTKVPYKKVMVHGFVLDDKKMKFSKSSGNGLSASQAVQLYGSDTLRLWACMQEEDTDAVFSEKKLVEAKTYYQRLRLSLRFLSSNAYALSLQEHAGHLQSFQGNERFDFYAFCLEELQKVENEYKNLLQHQQYKQALQALYGFCDRFLSQFVFEVMKQPLYLLAPHEEEKLMAQCFAFELGLRLMKMCSVFCPFVAEEFFEQTPVSTQYPSVFLLQLPHQHWHAKGDWNKVQEWRKMVHQLLEPMQQQKKAKSSSQLLCEWHLPPEDVAKWSWLCDKMNYQYWLGVSVAVALPASQVKLVVHTLHDDAQYAKCPRCWNYALETSMHKGLCQPCSPYSLQE